MSTHNAVPHRLWRSHSQWLAWKRISQLNGKQKPSREWPTYTKMEFKPAGRGELIFRRTPHSRRKNTPSPPNTNKQTDKMYFLAIVSPQTKFYIHIHHFFLSIMMLTMIGVEVVIKLTVTRLNNVYETQTGLNIKVSHGKLISAQLNYSS